MARKSNAHDLGVANIGRLVLEYSLPAIIATSAASLYNIIDRIFIGNGVGPLAISGLALTFPLMNISAAFGAMIGIGASTMVSIRLGQNDRKGATQILGNAVVLNVSLGVLVALIMLIFLDPILYTLGASDKTLMYAKEFIRVLLFGNIFTHLYLGLNNIMRASGYPGKAMFTTLATVIANLILAPVFIFVFNWGIQGAALATVCSQFIGTCIVVHHFSTLSSFIHFLPGYFKLNVKIIKDIFSIGMSNFFILLCGSLVFSIANISLKKYGGDFAIGAFGIVNGIANLVVMIVIGFNQGMQPIVGYNFGARQIDRVIRTYKITVFAGTCVTCLGFLLAQLLPGFIASAFTSNKELIQLAAQGLRLNLLLYPIVGFQIVTSSFFQSLGKAYLSIFLSLTRQVVFLIPALVIIPQFLGLKGIWLCGPMADIVSSILTLLVLQWLLKKLNSGEIFMKKS